LVDVVNVVVDVPVVGQQDDLDSSRAFRERHVDLHDLLELSRTDFVLDVDLVGHALLLRGRQRLAPVAAAAVQNVEHVDPGVGELQLANARLDAQYDVVVVLVGEQLPGGPLQSLVGQAELRLVALIVVHRRVDGALVDEAARRRRLCCLSCCCNCRSGSFHN